LIVGGGTLPNGSKASDRVGTFARDFCYHFSVQNQEIGCCVRNVRYRLFLTLRWR
jgi:hypothetical protein